MGRKISITCKERCTAERKAGLDMISLVTLMATYRDMQDRARKMLDKPFEGIEVVLHVGYLTCRQFTTLSNKLNAQRRIVLEHHITLGVIIRPPRIGDVDYDSIRAGTYPRNPPMIRGGFPDGNGSILIYLSWSKPDQRVALN